MKEIQQPNFKVMFKQSVARGALLELNFVDYLFFSVTSGEGTMKANGTMYELKKDDTFMAARKTRMEFAAGTETLQIFAIRLSVDSVRDFLLHTKKTPAAKRTDNANVQRLPNHLLLRSLIQGLNDATDNDYRAPMPLLYLKMQECLNAVALVQPGLYQWFRQKNVDDKINLREFMEDNCCENEPLEQMAAATGRSLSTFRRDFMAEFGTTPSRWLLQKRLETAYHYIADNQCAPSSFIYKIGFESFSHFSRTFKAQYGILPSELLKNSKGTDADPNGAY